MPSCYGVVTPRSRAELAAGGLLEKPLPLDDHARDPAGRDQPVPVADRDAEREASSFDELERRLGSDASADRCRCQVVELDAVSDACGCLREAPFERDHRRFLGHRHDPGGGEDGYVAGVQRERGVALAHDQLDGCGQTGAERHRPTIDNPGGGVLIEAAVLERALHTALRGGGDFAEVFAEDREIASARLDESRIEEFVSGRERGAGIRVVRGETTGFAHTADLSESGLVEAANAAAAAAQGAPGDGGPIALSRREVARPHPVRLLPESVDKARKAEMLVRADDAARAEDGAIRQVSATYADSRRRVLIANSDGLLVEDDRVRTRFGVQCVAVGDTGMQTGFEAPGRTVGFELFDEIPPEDVARTAARRALTMLRARPAPSGKLPVVLQRGAGGVLFHEACGHGLEADLVDKDASVFRGKVGQRVASPVLTLVDDGTYAREWGTFAVDDEGAPAQRNVLIEDGVLTDYMWDLVRARKAGRASSGNGRRETYQCLPMVRMTNTFILAGDDDPDDIIGDTEHGLYCVALGGGQVNTATGDFVFGITEAYMIERGEVTVPVRAAQLIGNGPQTLALVDAVGSDFDTWAGTCGKDGQGVPVSSGQPTLRVAELTVGGTAGA